MSDLDVDRPAVAGAILLLVVAILLVAIAMDARKLPLGRIKYMPWTYITITALFAFALAGRHLALVLLTT